MDAHQALLDARVAQAAEAWLTDPTDVPVYARLVAAVEQRRRWLDRAGRPGAVDRAPDPDGATHPSAVAGAVGATQVDEVAGAVGATQVDEVAGPVGATRLDEVAGPVGETHSSGSDDANGAAAHRGEPAQPADEVSDHDLDRSWPTVRAVGADLAGDPAAVLRRLRGG